MNDKAIIDGRPSLAMKHLWRHNAIFIIMHVSHHSVLWWHILSYLAMVMNPLINSDSDPGHLGGGPSHGHNTSYVKNQVNRSNSFWVTIADKQTDRQTDRQTDIPKCITLALLSGSEGIRLIHEFSRVRQPLHCDVIVGKQYIFNETRPCFLYTLFHVDT